MTKKPVYSNHRGRWGLQKEIGCIGALLLMGPVMTHDVMIHTTQHKFNKLKVSLFLGEEQDDAHSDKDDKVGQDVEAEERVGLLRVGALPGLVPKQQDQRVDGLRVQPAAAGRERGSDKNSWWAF